MLAAGEIHKRDGRSMGMSDARSTPTDRALKDWWYLPELCSFEVDLIHDDSVGEVTSHRQNCHTHRNRSRARVYLGESRDWPSAEVAHGVTITVKVAGVFRELGQRN